MQHSDQPDPAATSLPQSGGTAPRPITGGDLLPQLRRYLMTRSVVCGVVVVLLLLHLVLGKVFDLGTLLLLAILYALIVGTGGLEAARNSGAGSDSRRQERLAEDALRRAGRLQSHLEPCSATDDVVNRILASGGDPRRMAILAGNEVEDALRAVYRHFSDAERMAGTSNGTDLPLTFLVQELIWRALLSPDVYDTAEPILALRELAMSPRASIQPRVATDIARATQAVVLRVQSLGIDIHPRRVPLSWLREPLEDEAEPVAPDHAEETPEPSDLELFGPDDGDVIDGDRLDPTETREPVVRREARASSGGDGGEPRN
ncbi:MAG TPA: hypothetical protein VNL71_02650 [Chloroflexota bacterium]|nr:hypothetical protein [Chloroflexota bacterium]